MNTEQIDTLVVGGLAISPSVTKGINCKHLPFTSDGLQEATHLIPECKTVIVIPSKPGTRGTKRSSKKSIDENGHFAAIDSTILYQFQTHLYTLANGSASVYLLIPDDPDLRLFVGVNITIGLSFGTEHKWTRQLEGGRAWMLEGSKSSLVLNFANHYGVYEKRSHPLHFTKPLPNPDQLLLGMPRGKVITLGDCVVDCAGNIRVLELRWGKGAFVIGPESCLRTVLKRPTVPVVPHDKVGALRQAVEPPVAVPAGKKKPRRPNLNIASTYKTKAYGIWMSYRNDINGEPTYRDCYAQNEDKLKGLKILLEADLKRVCESEIKRLKSKK